MVSDTPYQVFNAIRLARYNEELKGARIDLFIGHQFTDSVKLAERVRQLALFDNVYDFYPEKNVRKTQRLAETVFPAYGIRKLMHKKPDEKFNGYDEIFLTLISEMSLCLALYNQKARVFYYDDGIGSYSRRMKPVSIIPRVHQAIYRALGRSLKKINVCGLYLNNPDMYNSDDFDPCEIHKIDPEERCEFAYIRSVFDVGNDALYRQYRYIYLTDPDFRDDYEICNTINRICKDVLIRPHPRHVDRSQYEGKIDQSPGMWELLALECIGDDHVLISGYSTAQLTPFILFGKEPLLIFTYRLHLSKLQGEYLEGIESMIELLKNKYSDKSKIIVVNDYQELKTVMKKFES